MALKMPRGQMGLAHPFGELNSNLTGHLDDYKSMGAQWVRTDFWWDQVRSDNFAAVERIVTEAKKRGLKVLAELQGQTPNGQGMNNDGSISDYGKWAAQTAARFKGIIDAYELWNEQNLRGFWPNPSPEWWAKSAKAAYPAIKGADPAAIVVSGGLSPAPGSGDGYVGAVEFLRRAYAAGAKGSFDAVGFHPYTWPESPTSNNGWNGWEIMERGIRDVMSANGDGDMQVWMTEFGTPTKSKNSEADQQRFLDEAMKYVWDADHTWAGPMFVYSYKDRGGNEGDTENYFGLLRPDGSRKPAYQTFVGWAGKSEGGTGTGGTTDGTTGGGTDTGGGTTPTPVATTEPYNPYIWVRSAANGSRVMRLLLSQQKYGDQNAQFRLTLDSTNLGTFSVVADYKQSQWDVFELKVPTGSHKVTLTFLNDAWGGSEDKDRNLVLGAVYLDGKSLKQSKVIGGPSEPFTFSYS